MVDGTRSRERLPKLPYEDCIGIQPLSGEYEPYYENFVVFSSRLKGGAGNLKSQIEDRAGATQQG